MEWDIQELDGHLHPLVGPAEGYTIGLKKEISFYMKKHVSIFKDRYMNWCTPLNELNEVSEKLFSALKNDKFLVRKIIKTYLKAENDLLDFFKELDVLDLSTLTNFELKNIYAKLDKLWLKKWSIAMFVEPFEWMIDKIVKEGLVQEKELFKKYFEILTMPLEDSFTTKHDTDLLRLAILIKLDENLKIIFNKKPEEILQHIKKYNPFIYNKILHHTKKYFWLRANYSHSYVMNELDFIKLIKEKITKEDLEQQLKNTQEFLPKLIAEKKKLLKQHKFSKNTLKLIKLIESLGFIHDYRKALTMKWIFYQEKVFNEIGKRFNYTADDLTWFLPSEIYALWKGKKLSKKIVNSRKRYCILYTGFSGHKVLIEKEAKAFENKYFKGKIKKESITDFKGICASKGTAIGKVKILYSAKESYKMKKGDILVAPMTRPEFVSAMKLAAAIITDQGGITSHAAIVAREFNIPCVVGTRIATKILKDNDLVEVRANHGAVGILKY